MNAGRVASGLILGAAVVALAGCAVPKVSTDAAAAVDPGSPVARDVAYAEKHPGPYPRFRDIPKLPKDVPPSSVIRSAVLDLKRDEAALHAQAAALPPPATDTEAFAAASRPRSPSAEAPGPNSPAQTEAYARALRERATPPPPLR